MWALPTCLPQALLVIARLNMFHHSESPEVIHAKLAEWERTVALHRSQREAERLLARDDDAAAESIRSRIERFLHRLRPADRMREQPGT